MWGFILLCFVLLGGRLATDNRHLLLTKDTMKFVAFDLGKNFRICKCPQPVEKVKCDSGWGTET